MYRAILPSGHLDCADYERDAEGVRLTDEAGTFQAFVPYENLQALVAERAMDGEDRSVP